MFYTREMEFRASLRYPPTVAMINVIVKGSHSKRRWRMRTIWSGGRVITIRMGRSSAGAGRARQGAGRLPRAVLHQGQQRKPMRHALTAALDERPELKRRVIIDVDPISVI